MSTEELLSKDEIDVLLNGVDEGQVETSTAPVDNQAYTYDLTDQDHIVRGQLPTLEMVNERFCRYTRTSMFNFLRQTAEIEPEAIRNAKYSEYLQSLHLPTSLNMVKMHPLKGTSLFVLDAALVIRLVDKFFGGGAAEEIELEEREFTATEQRIVRKVLDQMFIDLKEAWKSVMTVQFEYSGFEPNPSMAHLINPSEVVVINTFNIQIGGGTGKLEIVIPYSMLEPVRETLDAGVQADVDDTDERWLRSLREDIMYASVPLNCVVTERKITLREILNFKEGDVIPINMPETNTLMANGVPVFDAQLGRTNENLALKIIKRIGRPAKGL